jgi:hypothetical protein
MVWAMAMGRRWKRGGDEEAIREDEEGRFTGGKIIRAGGCKRAEV